MGPKSRTMKKLIVVTGMALTKHFSKEGHPVLMLARRQDRVEARHLPNCLCRSVDVTDLAAMEAAVREAEAVCGKTDLLIKCAGLMRLGRPDRQNFAEWSPLRSQTAPGLPIRCPRTSAYGKSSSLKRNRKTDRRTVWNTGH